MMDDASPWCVDHRGHLTNRVFLDDPDLQTLLALLNSDGETARVVGGAVRNAAIGLRPGDIDVTTTALPEAVLARAKAARLRTIPTGIAHGTVTVIVAGHSFEVTTLRQDVETNGRHAIVRFGRDYQADALRRDFTINALSVDAEGLIHDDTGGLADLAAGRVRFIGDPATRLREDYLRILRFFRFSASYAIGALDAEGLAACSAASDGLALLSRERIQTELMKLLTAPRAADVVEAMEEAGLLGRLLGGTRQTVRLRRFRDIESAGVTTPDALLCLAALALNDARDAVRLRNELRLSNAERDRLARLALCLAQCPIGSTAPDARRLATLLFEHGRQATCDAVMLLHAESDAATDDRAWLAAVRFAGIAEIPNLPVSGADIVERGVQSGPMVGQVLKRLQALWIRAGFPQSPAALHELLNDAIDAAKVETTES